MLALFIIRTILMVLSLLIIVPAVTGGSVAVRKGGILRGLLVYFILALVNSGLWLGFGILTAGGVVLANFLLLGLVGLCINALAFVVTGWLMPRTLQVESFGSGFLAALTMTFMSFVINWLI